MKKDKNLTKLVKNDKIVSILEKNNDLSLDNKLNDVISSDIDEITKKISEELSTISNSNIITSNNNIISLKNNIVPSNNIKDNYIEIDEIEKIKNDNISLKNENEWLLSEIKLKTDSNNINNDDDIINIYADKINKIYIELKNNYIGNNAENVQWRTVELSYIINLFLNEFDFLE